jgi:glyoxylase-like metal-dependent hydrolase (beta-lactamase superfamily II)
VYSVFALKFAEQDVESSEFFYREPSHDLVTLHFYVWLILGGPAPILVDTGFSDFDARTRELRDFVPPAEMVRRAGVDPATVTRAVMTHLHWDHWAGHRQFPAARFVVQGRELAFWTGRFGSNPVFARGINVDELAHIVPLTYSGHVELVDGDLELMPGIGLYRLGGHTEGTQIVVVDTENGPVVLAADASHFYRNVETGHPVQIASNMNDMLAGFDRIHELAGPAGLIVPGHDPAIAERFTDRGDGIIEIR